MSDLFWQHKGNLHNIRQVVVMLWLICVSANCIVLYFILFLPVPFKELDGVIIKFWGKPVIQLTELYWINSLSSVEQSARHYKEMLKTPDSVQC